MKNNSMTWEKFEGRNIICGILYVGLVPFSIVVSIIDHHFGLNNYFSIPLGFIWFIATATMLFKRWMMPCPSCGQDYYAKGKFVPQCSNCGAKPPQI
jgi:hypothetical protein